MTNDDVTIHGMAVGGDGVGRIDDGRVVFVPGTVTGDLVTVEVVEQKKRFVRGRVIAVVDASPSRVTPSCEAVGRGCGGCDWQHIGESARGDIQLELVNDVLRRQGGVAAAESRLGGSVPASGYRTTVRLGVADGRPGFRAARSNALVPVEDCLTASPVLADLIAANWGDIEEVTLRCGSRTGERLAVTTPSAPLDLDVGDLVRVVGRDELDSGKRAWIHEEAAGRRWRISADSFFQSSPEAAELIVDAVRGLAGDDLPKARSILDLYGGVGLFTGSLSSTAPDATWTLVDSAPSSLADARINLDDTDVNVIRSAVERFSAPTADVVIADPPRAGLARGGVRAVVASRAPLVVLVSCDLGALGRDVGLLRKAGYRMEESVVLDIFGHTSQLEVATSFRRVN